MSFAQAWLHLQLLAVLWLTVSALAAAWWAGSEEKRRQWTEVSWWLLPLPFALWLGAAAWVHGVQSDMVGAAVSWSTGWLLLRCLLQRSTLTTARGLMAALELAGLGLALFTDAAPFLRRAWLLQHSALTLFGVLLIGGAVWVARHRPDWVQGFFGPPGVDWALGLATAALPAHFLPWGKTATWALAMGAYLLGVTAVASRTAARPSVPANLYQWGLKWRWALVMAAIPTGVLLLLSDLAPSLVLLFTLTTTFWTLGQWWPGVGLLAFGGFSLFVGYQIGVPARLVERIHLVLRPTEGGSSQQLEALWALARGGLWGRGVGHFVLTPLPVTDGIGALVAETVGVFGVLAVLALVGLVGFWLWQEAQNASALRQRAWSAAIFTCWSLCHLWTWGWSAGRWVIMGLAAPLISAGVFNALFWTGVLALSVASALLPRSRAPSLHVLNAFPASARLWPVFPGLLGALVLTGLLQHGVFQREATLMSVFVDRSGESRCRDAVLSGAVTVRSGRPWLNQQRLPADLKQREEDRQRLQQWLEKGIFVVDEEGHLTYDFSAFRRSEPSGLGTVLRLAGGDRG